MRHVGWRWASGALLSIGLGVCLAGPAQAVTVPGDFPSIQAAINAVVSGAQPDGTVINLLPQMYTEAIIIASTPRSMTIKGVGGTVISGAGTGQPTLRIVFATGAIRIESLMLTGGNSTAAGGFLIQNSSPTLVNVTVQGNFTPGDGGGGLLFASAAVFDTCVIQGNTAGRFGGGVLMVAGSRPAFQNSQIKNNVSGASSNIGSGGGVHANDSSPTFRSSVISGNQSKFAGGGLFVLGIFGSAAGPAFLTLEDSEVSSNTTVRFGAADNPGEGGGIHIEDNAVGRLNRTRVIGNVGQTGGGLNSFRGRYEVVSSIIEGNQALDPQGIGGFGGGINAFSLTQPAVVTIQDSVIRNNTSRVSGGVHTSGDLACGAGGACATLTIDASVIDNNSATLQGGGVNVSRANLTVMQSQILRNKVTATSGGSFGGGLLIASAAATITNTTIADNSVREFGGGLFIDQGSVVNLSQVNIYRNTTTTSSGGGGLFVGSIGPSSGSVTNSTIADNTNFQIREQSCSTGVPAPILAYANNVFSNLGSNNIYTSPCAPNTAINSISTFNGLSPGAKTVGNVVATPSFATFLATPDKAVLTPAQASPVSVLSWVIARASSINITGVGGVPSPTGTQDVAPSCATTFMLTASPTPVSLSATVMPSGAASRLVPVGSGFFAYNPAFLGGVFVAFAPDIGGQPAIITGAGPGGGPHVRIFRPDGTPLGPGFFPYDPAFLGGVSVAFAPSIGGKPAVITAPGPGGGPHVRIFQIDPDGTATPLGLGFFAYDPAFGGGVTVGFGQNLGGAPGLVTAAGPGGGPHVRVFRINGVTGQATPVGGGFFAYDPAFTGGVTFAVGDLTGDGIAEIVTAPGPGGGPHVRFFNVDGFGNTTALGGGFFAYDITFTGGVFIAVGDVNGDGKQDLITAPGITGWSLVRVFSVTPSGVATPFFEDFAFSPGFTGGVRLAAGNTDGGGDPKAEIITAPGPTGGPTVRVFKLPTCP